MSSRTSNRSPRTSPGSTTSAPASSPSSKARRSGSGNTVDFGKDVQALARRKGGDLLPALRRQQLHRQRRAVQTTDTARCAELHRQARQVQRRTRQGRLLRRRRLQGRQLRRHRDRVGRRFPCLRRRRTDLQGRGRRVQGRHRWPTSDATRTPLTRAPSDSLADVYVDVGTLIEQAGGSVDPQALKVLKAAGDRPDRSDGPGQRRAGLRPDRDRPQQRPRRREAAQRRRLRACSAPCPPTPSPPSPSPGFGEQLKEAIDSLDAEGIPGTVPPHQLKKRPEAKPASTSKRSPARSRTPASSPSATSENSLGGALVLTDQRLQGERRGRRQHRSAAARLHVAGRDRAGGKASGFSVHSPELGRKPLVVVAKDERIAIGYGLAAYPAAALGGSGRALSRQPQPTRKRPRRSAAPRSAASSTGRQRCAWPNRSCRRPTQSFQEAKPYLAKVAYVALRLGQLGQPRDGEADRRLRASRREPMAAGVGIDLLEIERLERALESPSAPRRPRLHPGRAGLRRSSRPPRTPPRGAIRREGGGGQGARASPAASACARSRSSPGSRRRCGFRGVLPKRRQAGASRSR